MDSRRALVVEDNRVMAKVLTFNLQKAGFDVSTACSGDQGAALLESEDFDVVLTDYQMPGLTGEELCQRIRLGERNRDVPIFLISAKGYELDVERLQQEFRLSGVLEKPFSPKDIVSRVKQATAAAVT